jgi:TonB family protein
MGGEEARYLQMLQQRIEENWRAYLPPEQGVLGEVRIRISSDGGIREFSFVKGSGKSHVDASIVSAIKKVVLPPPPSSLADRPLVLRFWPSGQHP